MQSFLRVVGQFVLVAVMFALPVPVLAASEVALSGTISDSLGAVIQSANVDLLSENGKLIQSTHTDDAGRYSFAIASAGRFCVRAQAPTFEPASSEQQYVSGEHAAQIDLALSPSIVAQQIVVTAAGVPMPELQTGASISVIDEAELATRRTVEQELRVEPGVQLVSNGQSGGTTSLFVRGGPSNTTKVLIDGVSMNDVSFRYFNFANLSAAGFERAELHRGPDSALYGSDALSGVLALTTRRGETPLPELTYAAGGGTFGTLHQESSLAGAWRRFDYFAGLSRFDTQNSTPNSRYHNAAALANLGWQLPGATELRITGRRSASAFNSANAIDFYGVPDNGVTREYDTSFGATLENRANERWHNLVRYGGVRFRQPFVNFGCQPLDANGFCANPLGNVITLRGANGYEVTGQAQRFQNPSGYQSSLLSNRDSIYAQSDYRFNQRVAALFGFRYEAEGGYSYYNNPDYFVFGQKFSKSRGNYSYIMQLNGGLWNRLYYIVGSGLENNSVFGFAATPRASLAWHVVRPGDRGIFSGTRLAFNFAKGIVEPSIYHETHSVHDLVQNLGGSSLSAPPLRAELSRSFDGGVQQILFRGRARVSLTYFHNEYGDQAESVPFSVLTRYGVQQDVVDALTAANPFGYAYVNSLASRSQGVEVEAEYHIARNLSLRGGWTYTDAIVQKSFAGDINDPLNFNVAYNPAFPGIPIGAYSPLIGARPFRIAPHTGFFAVDWSTRRFTVRGTGTLVSRRDDSDFLAYSDASFGNSLLLPNRNLDPAYQRIDLYTRFHINRRMSLYTSMENLLNQRYYESFGYPALPFTIRSGVQFRLGGESWKL
jgi:vitamin B12 transporter